MISKHLTHFTIQNNQESVKYLETLQVTNGVSCDAYSFPNAPNKDLAIIHIKSGCKTPLQKVLLGEKTIEGYVSGKGKLTLKRKDGKTDVFEANNLSKTPLEILVNIGDTMQWSADKDSPLEVYEICYPPYEDGRYENL